MPRLVPLCLMLWLASPLMAQTSPATIPGARFDGTALGSPTNDSFSIGMTLDGGASWVTTAHRSDSGRITGILRADPANRAAALDVFLVDRVNGRFTMRNQEGAWVDWVTGRIADLQPFREKQVLGDSLELTFYEGELGEAGEHRLFMGYLAPDGSLRYTPTPHIINVTEQSPRDQAFDLFTSAVSGPVVQGLCITCHVSGGSAAGLSLHTFVRSTNANHLTLNFAQFENLVKVRGRDYVLGKTLGQNGHGGGQQLFSTMQEYRDLDTMLSLLAQ